METRDREERIALLGFLLEVIRQDLKMDLLSKVLYSGEHFEEEVAPILPSHYYDEAGYIVAVYPDRDIDGILPIERVTVNLVDNCVWVLPWNTKSLRGSILNLWRYDFRYDKNNHWAYYFTHMDVCFVYNGRHSAAAGIVNKKGNIEAVKVDVSRLFEHVSTDGAHWYYVHDGSIIGDVADFRIGILYEIARRKGQLPRFTNSLSNEWQSRQE